MQNSVYLLLAKENLYVASQKLMTVVLLLKARAQDQLNPPCPSSLPTQLAWNQENLLI